ncbi:hypothetical protein FB107DRAFT_225190 [Schizophyllum commune]
MHPLDVELQGPSQALQLSHDLSDAGDCQEKSASIRRRMYNLGLKPSFLHFLLTTNPAEIPDDEWRPLSRTVEAVTLSFLAMTAISRAWSSDPSSSDAPPRCAGTFFPPALLWIPHLHPLYSSLKPELAHIRPLVDVIQALNAFTGYGLASNEHIASLYEHTVALWYFLLLHPRVDVHPDQNDHPLHSEVLGMCTLRMLSSPMYQQSYGLSAMSVRTLVRDTLLWAAKASPRRLLELLFCAARSVHDRDVKHTLFKGSSALRQHLQAIGVLMRDVFPTARLSQSAVKIVVDLGRQTPCSCAIESVCNLLLVIWMMDHSGGTLKSSLKAGLVYILLDDLQPESATAKAARESVFRYIAVRTSSYGVLRTLSKQDNELPCRVGESATNDPILAEEARRTIQARMDSLDECSSRRICAIKSHWKLHKRRCVWYRYRLASIDHIGSPSDMGFTVLQVIQYLRSDHADGLFETLAKLQQKADVRIQIFLNELPPHAVIVYTPHTSSLGHQVVLALRAQLFVRGQASTIVFEPRPLAQFLSVFEGVSIHIRFPCSC